MFIWLCPPGSERINTTGIAPNRVDTPQCAQGQGAYMDMAEAIAEFGAPPAEAAVSPEQAAVQVAMVATVGFSAMKGLAIGLMR